MSPVRALGLALTGFLALALAGIILRPLLPIDETRYLSVAWEMWQGGSWLVPHKNGAIYSDKPPLLFWLIALVWGGVGPSELAARLVGPVFGAAMIGLTHVLARRLWDDARAAALSALVLAGTVGFALYGGLTMFDTMLGTATLLAMLALLWAGVRRGPAPWVALGAAMAFGVYAKGPVILFHVAPALMTAPLWVQGLCWRRLARGAALALAVALALVALWVVPAAIGGGPEYRRLILWDQSAGRIESSFAHARPWWFIIAALPVMLFPWVWMPGIWRGLARLRPDDRGVRLCVVWASTGIVLFSAISGKQLHYILPELPAIALLIGRAMSGAPLTGWLGARIPALAVLAGAVLIAAAALGLAGAGTAQALDHVGGPLTAALMLVLLAVAAWQMDVVAGGAALGLGIVLAADLVIGLTALHRDNDASVIGRALAPAQAQGLAVVTDRYNAEFNFAGRLTRTLDVLAPAEAQGWLTAHPGGLLTAPCNAAGLTAAPDRRVRFHGEDWCLWRG